MAVTITIDDLRAALRLTDSPEETAEVTRLLAYAADAVVKDTPNAPDTAHNEAVRRLVGYLYDMPEAGRGDAYGNAMRSSGAARMMLPYRVHRAGYADAVGAAQAAIGTAINPVTGIDIVGTVLTVTFEDGTTETFTLPSGGSTLDQTARDEAAAAQTSADAAQTSADTKVARADVVAGNGINITPTSGSDTGFTIAATGGGGGGETGIPGNWQWVSFFPDPGEVQYVGAVIPPAIDTWRIGTSGNLDAQNLLLSLVAGGTVEFRQSNSRHQTVTLTEAPTLSGTRITVTGSADRGQSSQLPANNSAITITVTGLPMSDVDQIARDAAAAAQAVADSAQSEADTNQLLISGHAASVHNHDTTARQDAIDAANEVTNHEAATNPHMIAIYTDADADLRVQAAQGSNVPVNTPGMPNAGDTPTWSPDNHDHGFDPGHGGTGDITGIVTASDSGLAGGVNGGEATLSLDLSGLDEMNGQYLHRDTDRLYVEYRSDTSNVRRQISLFELVQGLMRATNTFHQRPADNDRFFIMDVSYEGGTPRYIDWTTLRERFTKNDAIDLAQPATEDDDWAPTRQAVAEAIASVTGTLVPGNEALDELRWRNGTWTPISPVTATYIAITRGNTFTSLNQLFTDVATNTGGVGYSANGALLPANRAISASNRTSDPSGWPITVDAIWPVGEDAPFVWLITPTFYDWQANFTANFITENGTDRVELINGVAFPNAGFSLTIDGVPFQVAALVLPLARPVDTDWMSVSASFTADATPTRVVLEVT